MIKRPKECYECPLDKMECELIGLADEEFCKDCPCLHCDIEKCKKGELDKN